MTASSPELTERKGMDNCRASFAWPIIPEPKLKCCERGKDDPDYEIKYGPWECCDCYIHCTEEYHSTKCAGLGA